MKRFGFSAYIVDDANSEALGACRGVARLQTERPQPIILVGDHGCGKTHLLHSIVNDVRASSSHTGIAYVSPCNLPDEVRKLVDDPTPVDLAQKAILLVDDLDRFDDDLRVLGDVVRIFLENDHYVVFASRIHPNRLNAVPPELRAALEKARVVEIAAGDTQRQVNLIERRIRQESEETIARQNREIEDLKARPNVAYPGHEKAQGERDDVAALRDCVEERSVDLSESRERLTAANEEIEHLKAESALLAKTSQEKDSQPLEDTHAEAREAREEAAGMLERAERLMQQMEESRGEFLQAQEEKARQISEIEKLEDVYAQAKGGQNESVEEGTRDDSKSALEDEAAAQELAKLHAELKAIRDERDTLQREREQLQGSIVRTHSERDTIKSLLERARKELDELHRDIDALKQEAAQQVETEKLRADTLRHSLDESREKYLEQIATQRAAVEELMALHSQLLQGSNVLERLMVLFGLPLAGGAAVDEADAEPETGPEEGAPEAEPEIQEQDTRNSILRADFGEPARLSPAGSSTLHHVEELRSRPAEIPGGATGDDGIEEELEPPQDRHKSA
ncbi:MAG: DnaA/Hda family protein [Candidatus Hydrogenedentes bacterium]|nr:DnaA/Hda family protein [Candidatus Hydrogenedentota bacterium]